MYHSTTVSSLRYLRQKYVLQLTAKQQEAELRHKLAVTEAQPLQGFIRLSRPSMDKKLTISFKACVNIHSTAKIVLQDNITRLFMSRGQKKVSLGSFLSWDVLVPQDFCCDLGLADKACK